MVLIDDHSLFRRGIAQFLKEEGIAVVAEAANGEDGIRAVVRFSPDVVVMDIHMSGMSGIEATRKVLERSPGVRVLTFTVSGDDDDVLRAIAAGASGYLLKDAPMDEPRRGDPRPGRGRFVDLARGGRPLLRQLQQHADEAAVNAALTPELSEREARRAQAPDAGSGEHADRRRPLHQHGHGEEPHLGHPREARRGEQSPGRGLRGSRGHRLGAWVANPNWPG
ncbi:MAG: response regulator transcription factor [Thermoleophilaceae bacterium]